MTPEGAQLQGNANQMLENNLSSVFIFTKTDMKTGKQHTDWEVKCKHEDPAKAKDAALAIDKELRDKYGNSSRS